MYSLHVVTLDTTSNITTIIIGCSLQLTAVLMTAAVGRGRWWWSHESDRYQSAKRERERKRGCNMLARAEQQAGHQTPTSLWKCITHLYSLIS